jgi:hypothetical protein
MESCVHVSNQDMLLVAMTSNRLGWDSFVEGRIVNQWLSLVTPLLACTNPHLLENSWGCQFISRFHNVIHKQWVYQNLLIHYKGKDGLTLTDHHEILNCVEGYSLIDPETLFPRHRFLLDVDFETLGSGPTSHCLLWLAGMESAVATSQLALSGTLTPEAMAYFSSTHVSCLYGAFLDVASDA